MINNPYAILEIDETASIEQIMNSVKSKIEKYCSHNSVDADYLRNMFFDAAKTILISRENSKINIETRGLTPIIDNASSISIIIENQKIVYFNSESLAKSLKPCRSVGALGSDLADVYAILGEDGSFHFIYSECFSDRRDKTYCSYSDIFPFVVHFNSNKAIHLLKDGDVINEEGLKSICFMANRFLPKNIIRMHERVQVADLANICCDLSYYFANNLHVVQKTFDHTEGLTIFSDSEMTEHSTIVPLSQNKKVSVIAERNKIIYFNRELLLKSLQVSPSKTSEKIKLANIYAHLGEDSSFYFTYMIKRKCTNYDQHLYRNVFLHQTGRDEFIDPGFLEDGKICKEAGKNYICLLGSRFIPSNMVEFDEISLTNLENVCYYVSRYFQSNPQVVKEIFGEKTEENTKIYYL